MTGEKNASNTPGGLFANLNHMVLWPPFLLLLAAIALNFIAPDSIGDDGKKVAGAFSVTVNGAFLEIFIIAALIWAVLAHKSLSVVNDPQESANTIALRLTTQSEPIVLDLRKTGFFTRLPAFE